MKIVRFKGHGETVEIGVVHGDLVRSLGVESTALVDRVLTASAQDLKGLADASARSLPLQEQVLLNPLPRPRRVLALAGNFPGGGRAGLPDGATPWFFSKWSDGIGGPGDPIELPPLTRDVAPEIELAAVIGATARDVRADRALAIVGHFTIANDVSARTLNLDADRRPGKFAPFFDWLNGKWFDGYLALGPCLVPRELLDVADLEITTIVNEEVCVVGRTSEMAFGVADAIAYASRFMTLRPGDVICMGAKPAAGQERYLRAGDTVEGAIEGIGQLRNVVAAATDAAEGGHR